MVKRSIIRVSLFCTAGIRGSEEEYKMYLVSSADLLPLLAIDNLAIELVTRHLHVGLHLLDRNVQVVFYICQVLIV